VLSHRAPTPRPLSHLAQSVIAFDHSPRTVYRFWEENAGMFCLYVQANWSQFRISTDNKGQRESYSDVFIKRSVEFGVAEYLVLMLKLSSEHK
jgi:hypothetical protein